MEQVAKGGGAASILGAFQDQSGYQRLTSCSRPCHEQEDGLETFWNPFWAELPYAAMSLIELISWGFFFPSFPTKIKTPPPAQVCRSPLLQCDICSGYQTDTQVFTARQISIYLTSREAFIIKLLLRSAYEQKAQGRRGSPVPASLVSCQFKPICPWPALCLNFFHLSTVYIKHSCISLHLVLCYAKQEILLIFFSFASWGRSSNHPPACSGFGPDWGLGSSFAAVF